MSQPSQNYIDGIARFTSVNEFERIMDFMRAGNGASLVRLLQTAGSETTLRKEIILLTRFDMALAKKVALAALHNNERRKQVEEYDAGIRDTRGAHGTSNVYDNRYKQK